MIPIEEFLRRLPGDAKTERALIETALAIPANLKEKTAAVRLDENLSDAGKNAKVREIASGSPLDHLRQIQKQTKAMSTDIANLRGAMQIKPPEPGSLLAAQQREIRDRFLALPEEGRFRLAKEDPAIGEAILNGPHPAFSGLPKEQIELIRQSHIERLYGAQIAGLEKRKAIIEVVAAAVEIATKQFAAESGLTVAEIGEAA